MMRPELSIVIPFLNEEYVLPLLCGRLESVENRPLNWELLFVSDGSTDGSSRFIEAWASKDPSVKLIVLTRNFGHQNAVSAGLSFALGNYVGIMDADLQDEPEILLEMYRTLRKEKVDIVYAVRAARRESRLKRFFYSVFYRLTELIDYIKAEGYNVEISDNYQRDPSEDADVGAYIALIDGVHREPARKLAAGIVEQVR